MLSCLKKRRIPFVMLGLALLCIGLQFSGHLLWSLCSLVLWLSAMAIGSPRALSRLWLPKFWLMTLIIALASGMLLGPTQVTWGPIGYSLQGLDAGLLMVVRGAFIFALTNWLSQIVNRTGFLNWVQRAGFVYFSAALGAAFNLLPELKKHFGYFYVQDSNVRDQPDSTNSLFSWRNTLFQPWAWGSQLFNGTVVFLTTCVHVAEDMAQSNFGDPSLNPNRLTETIRSSLVTEPAKQKIAAIIGQPGSGKTTVLTQILHELQQSKIIVDGVTQPAIYENNKKVGYYLRDWERQQQKAFIHQTTLEKATIGRFRFDDTLWPWAQKIIWRSCQHAQIVVIDELGRLEAQGKGHMPALLKAAAKKVSQMWLVVVRKDCIQEIQQQMGCFDVCLYLPEQRHAVQTFVENLHCLLDGENKCEKRLKYSQSLDFSSSTVSLPVVSRQPPRPITMR